MHNDREPLLSERSALIFTLAGLAGVGAGILTAWKGGGPAAAVLVGAAAFGSATYFFRSIIA
ncbi:hypothetical protein [Streptomyces sp. NPDC048106]|uniref:hypothetical protein n=1 Tax=Streptomyces sp. NPDC048106 TaxID=3155750 RepID=UPI0034535028